MMSLLVWDTSCPASPTDRDLPFRAFFGTPSTPCFQTSETKTSNVSRADVQNCAQRILPSYHRISDVSHSLAASDHPKIMRRSKRRFSILRLCPPANERWCARLQARDVVRLVKARTRPEPQKTSIARHPTARVQDQASVCMPAYPSASPEKKDCAF